MHALDHVFYIVTSNNILNLMENESIKKNAVEIVRNKNRHELTSELQTSNSDSKRKGLSVQEIIEKMSGVKIDEVCVFFFIYKL